MERNNLFPLLPVFFLYTFAMALAVANVLTDQSVLLDFKSRTITLDPSHVLSRNWTNSTSVCTWIGVTCDSRHHRVAALDVPNMGLTGNLPTQLANLSFLVSLNLSSNNFKGNVPQDIARLRRLRVIDFSYNSLSGDMPSWFGFLPRLQILHLRNNSFTGFFPPSLSNMSEIEDLDLSHNALEGSIPQEFGYLQNLKVFILGYNQLSGSIPLTLFNLSNMETFDLTWNYFYDSLPDNMCNGLPRLGGLYLSANKLYGEIPTNLSGCSNLKILSLSHNKFTGSIPRNIGNLRQLEILYIGDNNLTGEIPEELGNITALKELSSPSNQLTGSIRANTFNISSLRYIDIIRNKLSGSLPPDICSHLKQLEVIYLNENNLFGYIPRSLYKCSALRVLGLTSNNLVGSIPREIGNSTLLQRLYLTKNKLTGVIPEEIGSLYNLEEFSLDGNNISGLIPRSLWNMSMLRVLSVAGNQLTGNLPVDIGQGLPKLEVLQVFGNILKSESPGLSFITSLTYCRNLRVLSFGSNPLNGILPTSIGNLSTSLKRLYLYDCGLRGTIPDEIGNLSNLVVLSLFRNHLTGSFPKTLVNLQSLQGLFLYGNKINGTIPRTICELKSLDALVLSENEIHGAIPVCIGNITTLRTLMLDKNHLDSSLPLSLWHLTDLLQLTLSSNSLNGSLPLEIGNLEAAILIDLSMNQFSGFIPRTIGGLQDLSTLSLAGNKIGGTIPESMSKMVSLEILDLSQNNLSGVIPMSLEELGLLESFNVSFNDLSGEIPSGGPFKNFTRESFMSNEGLCGEPRYQVQACSKMITGRPKRKPKFRDIFICSGASIFVLIIGTIGIAYGLARQRRKEIPQNTSDFHPEIAPLRVSNYELREATDGYSESNLLGRGSFGSVYRGTLRNGMAVAIKVFHSTSEGAFESFEVECEVLRNIRHRNLCKVIGLCSNPDFKALILEYMPNGSLERWLYSDSSCLDIIQRINIMIDVASALEYLHHGYSMPIVHCDLKPSNVLLDGDMVAHLCDFGIAKLLSDDESSIHTMTLATFGYIAPEFGLDGHVSMRCDAYSYGIMLMEVFTRMRPSDETFCVDLSLRSWVKGSMPGDLVHIIDSNLLSPNDESSWSALKLNCLQSVMELALSCTAESPHDRISMKDANVCLKKIKYRLLTRSQPDHLNACDNNN